jgi:Methyltransferase domain
MGARVEGAGVDRVHPIYTSQAAYTRLALRLYDAIVYGFNCPVLWRCPKSQIVELYNACVSGRHLDIGVATGCLLDECRFPVSAPEITLMDLNRNALATASRTLARYEPRTHRANVLEAWGVPSGGYDSVGMSGLIHCLPGSMPEKTVVFEHARTALAPGGVFFGTTILGQGVEHSWASRAVLWYSNRRGLVSTANDSLEALDAGLARVFDSHEIRVQGVLALFSARVSA